MKEKIKSSGGRPTADDLQRLDLKKPLKLTTIKTRGSSYGLVGIQLIFEGGIESTIFDTAAGDSTPFVSFDMKDQKMTSIEV